MNRFFKQAVLAVALTVGGNLSALETLSAQTNAQTSGAEKKEIPNPERAARRQTDKLKADLALTDKQYKKIYKLNLQEQKDMVKNMSNQGMPPMPPRGNRPEGMPPMGVMPMNGRPEGGFGSRPQTGDMSQQMEKKDKQMKKILTEDQYKKWKAMPQDKGARPQPPKGDSEHSSEKRN